MGRLSRMPLTERRQTRNACRERGQHPPDDYRPGDVAHLDNVVPTRNHHSSYPAVSRVNGGWLFIHLCAPTGKPGIGQDHHSPALEMSGDADVVGTVEW